MYHICAMVRKEKGPAGTREATGDVKWALFH
jgi:hypothetical protein